MKSHHSVQSCALCYRNNTEVDCSAAFMLFRHTELKKQTEKDNYYILGPGAHRVHTEPSPPQLGHCIVQVYQAASQNEPLAKVL